MNILNGITVVDLSSVLAGPSVASFLAELGAQVIRIENLKSGGDVTRQWKTAGESPGGSISAYYASVNFGKSTRLADLSHPAVQAEVHHLLETADVLVQNFKPADLSKFQLEPEVLKKRYPQLIHCHLTGFKSDASRVAYDVVLQAETGYMSMNGTAESGAVKMPVAMIDVLAAHQMKTAIALALFRRAQEQRGGYIHVTLEEAAISALTNQATNYLMNGQVAQRMGSQHPNIAPYGDCFKTADQREIVLAIGSDRQFSAFCTLIDAVHLAGDARFSTNTARVNHRRELNQALEAHLSAMPADALLAACHDQKIPVGEIKTIDRVFENPVAQSMVRESRIDDQAARYVSALGFTLT
jgi:crotonobetainyl-CoA:carnitine CoA-transferase CaiB-like acyl-CoA transferase